MSQLDLFSSVPNLPNNDESSEALLARLQTFRAVKYEVDVIPEGGQVVVENPRNGAMAKLPVHGCIVIERPLGLGERAGTIVLVGLTAEDARDRCERANAGQGLGRHLWN